MPDGSLTRRKFLARSGAATGALTTLRLSSSRALGANDRISIGVIGCGGRGSSLMGDARKQEDLNVEITAICDVWRPGRERTVARVKEWYGREPRAFSRYEELLALDDVDAVIIATPDFAHSPILTAAARAGKDAYCEKPMATKLEDAKAAVDAVTENERVVQIGTQRRSDGRHKGAAELIQSGVLGTISEVEAAFHDANPRWARGYGDVREEDVDWEGYLVGLPKRPFDPARFRRWHLYKDYTVGTPGLLGSHMMDVAIWFMDDLLPLTGTANGGIFVWDDGREHADTLRCLLTYPKGWLLNYCTRLGNTTRPADLVFYGLKGTFDTSSWTAKGDGGGREKLAEPVKAQAKPGENHMRNWLECIRSREKPNAPIEAGYAHSVASIMCFQAFETGRTQAYDAEKREIRPV